MNTKYFQLSSLLEAKGEYKDYDKEMEKFFPTTWNMIKGAFENIFPIWTKRLDKEEKLFKTYVKNLDVEIRLTSDVDRNCSTIPMISDRRLAVTLPIPFLQIPLFAIISLPKIIKVVFTKDILLKDKIPDYHKGKSIRLHKDTLAERKDKIVYFPKNKLKILIFVTKGLITDLEPKERIAVYLHEVGHWASMTTSGLVDVNKIIKIMAASLSKRFSSAPFLVLLAFISIIVWSRHAEYVSDFFVTKLGYGEELKSALDKIASKPRKNVTWLISVQDHLSKFFTHVDNFIDKYLPLTDHPSNKKRFESIDKIMKEKIGKFIK